MVNSLKDFTTSFYSRQVRHCFTCITPSRTTPPCTPHRNGYSPQKDFTTPDWRALVWVIFRCNMFCVPVTPPLLHIQSIRACYLSEFCCRILAFLHGESACHHAVSDNAWKDSRYWFELGHFGISKTASCYYQRKYSVIFLYRLSVVRQCDTVLQILF